MTKFFYFLEEAFNALFAVVPYIGGLFNVIFIILAVVFTVYWIKEMTKHNEERGTYNPDQEFLNSSKNTHHTH